MFLFFRRILLFTKSAESAESAAGQPAGRLAGQPAEGPAFSSSFSWKFLKGFWDQKWPPPEPPAPLEPPPHFSWQDPSKTVKKSFGEGFLTVFDLLGSRRWVHPIQLYYFVILFY